MAKYIYQEKAIQSNGKNVIHPRFAKIRHLNTSELVKHMAHGNEAKRRELTLALMTLADELPRLLAEGCAINLDKIGTLSPTLQMRADRMVETTDPDGTLHKSNAQSVEFGSVRFTPSKTLIHSCRSQCRDLEHDTRRGDSGITIHNSTREERIALLLKYLNENHTINVKQYAELTGISYSSSSRELNIFYSSKDPIIKRNGSSPHIFYTKL